jgi:hypothetical protein
MKERLISYLRAVLCTQSHPLAGGTTCRKLQAKEWPGKTWEVLCSKVGKPPELGKTCKRMAKDGFVASPERVSGRASSACLSRFGIRDALDGLPTKVDLHVWAVTPKRSGSQFQVPIDSRASQAKGRRIAIQCAIRLRVRRVSHRLSEFTWNSRARDFRFPI